MEHPFRVYTMEDGQGDNRNEDIHVSCMDTENKDLDKFWFPNCPVRIYMKDARFVNSIKFRELIIYKATLHLSIKLLNGRNQKLWLNTIR